MWQRRLRHSINSSIGKLKQLSLDKYKDDISNWFDFWRFLRIDEIGFLQQAEVGDIVLSSVKKKFQVGQKPTIDKVGMIVKLQ